MTSLGAETMQRQGDPRLAWAQRIEKEIPKVTLNLCGPPASTDHNDLAFSSAALVSLDDLENQRPGLKESILRQVQGRPDEDRLPIAFLTYANGSAIDLTTVTFSVDINAPCPFPPGTMLDDAVVQLLAFIMVMH